MSYDSDQRAREFCQRALIETLLSGTFAVFDKLVKNLPSSLLPSVISLHIYMPSTMASASTVEQIELKKELAKRRPRKEALMMLMAGTFSRRRERILSSSSLPVAEIVKEYPLLNKSDYVCEHNDY